MVVVVVFVLLSAGVIQPCHKTRCQANKVRTNKVRTLAPRSPWRLRRRCPAQRLPGGICCREPQCSTQPVPPHMQHWSRSHCVARSHRQKVENLLRLQAQSAEGFQHHRERFALVPP